MKRREKKGKEMIIRDGAERGQTQAGITDLTEWRRSGGIIKRTTRKQGGGVPRERKKKRRNPAHSGVKNGIGRHWILPEVCY